MARTKGKTLQDMIDEANGKTTPTTQENDMNATQAVETMKTVAKAVKSIGAKKAPAKKAVKAAPAPKKAVKTAAKKAVKTVEYGSKMEHAIALFKSSKDQSRAAMIKVFMNEVGLTKAGSQTYFYLVRSKV